jgi:hypothetical protein
MCTQGGFVNWAGFGEPSSPVFEKDDTTGASTECTGWTWNIPIERGCGYTVLLTR